MMRYCEDCGSPLGRAHVYEGIARTERGHDLTTLVGVRECLGIPTGSHDHHQLKPVDPRELAQGVLEILRATENMSSDQRQKLRDALERLKL